MKRMQSMRRMRRMQSMRRMRRMRTLGSLVLMSGFLSSCALYEDIFHTAAYEEEICTEAEHLATLALDKRHNGYLFRTNAAFLETINKLEDNVYLCISDWVDTKSVVQNNALVRRHINDMYNSGGIEKRMLDRLNRNEETEIQ